MMYRYIFNKPFSACCIFQNSYCYYFLRTCNIICKTANQANVQTSTLLWQTNMLSMSCSNTCVEDTIYWVITLPPTIYIMPTKVLKPLCVESYTVIGPNERFTQNNPWQVGIIFLDPPLQSLFYESLSSIWKFAVLVTPRLSQPLHSLYSSTKDVSLSDQPLSPSKTYSLLSEALRRGSN